MYFCRNYENIVYNVHIEIAPYSRSQLSSVACSAQGQNVALSQTNVNHNLAAMVVPVQKDLTGLSASAWIHGQAHCVKQVSDKNAKYCFEGCQLVLPKKLAIQLLHPCTYICMLFDAVSLSFSS